MTLPSPFPTFTVTYTIQRKTHEKVNLSSIINAIDRSMPTTGGTLWPLAYRRPGGIARHGDVCLPALFIEHLDRSGMGFRQRRPDTL